MDSKFLCVIPARGGSKRVPNKNIRDMDGEPMISYSIRVAQNTALFDDIYVATEDEEIRNIAQEYGATVPYLMPDDLCGDKVASHQPAQHLARSLSEEGYEYHTLVLLQPTSPLRIPDDIQQGVEKYNNGNYNFIVSVTHIDPHYFHWAMEENDDGYWNMHFGDEYLKERPLLPDKYRPNGSIKIADIESLKQKGHFFGDKCGVIETPRRRSIHVGTEFEFEITESLLERRNMTER
jgi:CMP-N-acetylneuraminic acid synthetase